MASDTELNDLEHDVPDGWVRQVRTAGMDTVSNFNDHNECSGGYKCDSCEHYVPIKSIDDDACPMCERRGMIGTVVMGLQQVTVLSPEGWFDE